jgi:hypothetical protein
MSGIESLTLAPSWYYVHGARAHEQCCKISLGSLLTRSVTFCVRFGVLTYLHLSFAHQTSTCDSIENRCPITFEKGSENEFLNEYGRKCRVTTVPDLFRQREVYILLCCICRDNPKKGNRVTNVQDVERMAMCREETYGAVPDSLKKGVIPDPSLTLFPSSLLSANPCHSCDRDGQLRKGFCRWV